METCDVLIVGGGPAGSSCARQLRLQGRDVMVMVMVMVMDKALFPRDKVCAGWITPADEGICRPARGNPIYVCQGGEAFAGGV